MLDKIVAPSDASWRGRFFVYASCLVFIFVGYSWFLPSLAILKLSVGIRFFKKRGPNPRLQGVRAGVLCLFWGVAESNNSFLRSRTRLPSLFLMGPYIFSDFFCQRSMVWERLALVKLGVLDAIRLKRWYRLRKSSIHGLMKFTIVCLASSGSSPSSMRIHNSVPIIFMRASRISWL